MILSVSIASEGNGRGVQTGELAKTTRPLEGKKRILLTEEQQQVKKESDKKRDETKVNLGRTFTPWRVLHKRHAGCRLSTSSVSNTASQLINTTDCLNPGY